MYIKTKENKPFKFPYTFADLRRDNPNVSFPENISIDALAAFDVYPVVATLVPEFDSKTHRAKQSVKLINNVWTQVWNLEEIPETEASANIRAERNHRLTECDWTQLEDSPLNADEKLAWALYRETLRMIPQQTGFPYNVTWPTKPQ